MRDVIIICASLLAAFIYFIHALRCINCHNGTYDWILIETTQKPIKFTGICGKLTAMDFICFPLIAAVYLIICIAVINADIYICIATAAASGCLYIAAKLISGHKAASAAAQVLFLYDLFVHFDTFASFIHVISFILSITFMFIYITRDYDKMFSKALPLLFLSGLTSGLGSIAFSMPAIIFLYIFTCTRKFGSEQQEYMPASPAKAIIFGIIALVIVPCATCFGINAIKLSAMAFDNITFLTVIKYTFINAFSKSYLFMMPITLSLGLLSMIFCVYCLVKFRSARSLVLIVFAVNCALASVFLSDYTMLMLVFCLALAFMFSATNRHRPSGIICPISACAVFVMLKVIEMIL